MRILQLTISAIVFMVVSGVSFFFIEMWSGGRLQRWHSAPFTGNVGDACIAIELACLPLLLGGLTCWGVVRLFRMRSIHNEIDDTFVPVLTVVAGYGRFLLIIISAIYLILGQGWAAALHLAVAVIAFTLFYRTHRARERPLEPSLESDQEEGEDES